MDVSSHMIGHRERWQARIYHATEWRGADHDVHRHAAEK